MPYLHTIGVSNTGQNFKFIYCVLLGKTEANYNFTI